MLGGVFAPVYPEVSGVEKAADFGILSVEAWDRELMLVDVSTDEFDEVFGIRQAAGLGVECSGV